MEKVSITCSDMSVGDDSIKSRRPRGNRFGRQPRKILLLMMGCATAFLILRRLIGFTSPTSSFLHIAPSSPSSPSSVGGTFPKKIWQSWKVDPTRFEFRDAERARTWTVKNPTYRYEVLTDDNAMSWVEEHYGPNGLNRPDIVSTYRDLENIKIIQSDLLRYLIMYAVGGVYADIDVEALRSIDHFIPKRVDQLEIDMLIGVETDEPRLKNHPILGSKSQSFCQWTFMCKPRVPVMMKLIDHILDWINDLARAQNKPISEVKLDFDGVLSGTGPSAFTNAILDYMSEMTRSKVTWDDFHNLEESTVVGRVLVLPAEAMAAGTGHSDSGNHGGRAALVKHHFHASTWTDTHPRKKHPVYGEVESCNWNVDCVALWDANTAFFSSLPEEVQLKMIEIKELDEAQKPGVPAAQAGKGAPVPDRAPPIAKPPTEPVPLPDVGLGEKGLLAAEMSEIDPKMIADNLNQKRPTQDKQDRGKNGLHN